MKKILLIIPVIFIWLIGCQKQTPNEPEQVDVYVAGKEYSGSIAVAKYWKNGQAIVLGDGVHWSTANSIVLFFLATCKRNFL
jgi:hypothetical protein